MAIYSITDLEKLTGIKAHTIRIWEKRYGIVIPKRTATNFRYYDDDDLRKVSNIALLNHKGYKISQLSEMQNEKIEDLVADLSEVESFNADAIDAFTLAVLQLDKVKIVYLLKKNIAQLGFDETFEQLILPLLDKMHDMWLSGSIKKAHEEFLNQIIKRKLIVELSNPDINTPKNKIKVVLFLSPAESQELSCLHIEYYLQKQGCQVIHLGNQMNAREIIELIQISQPQFVFTFIQEEESLETVEDILKANFSNPDSPLFLISGYYANRFEKYEKLAKQILDFNDLKEFISALLTLAEPDK